MNYLTDNILKQPTIDAILNDKFKLGTESEKVTSMTSNPKNDSENNNGIAEISNQTQNLLDLNSPTNDMMLKQLLLQLNCIDNIDDNDVNAAGNNSHYRKRDAKYFEIGAGTNKTVEAKILNSTDAFSTSSHCHQNEIMNEKSKAVLSDIALFNETNIPDLSDGLSPIITAELKSSLENSTDNGTDLLIQSNRLLNTPDIDTAPSSDNDTFTDCQSYTPASHSMNSISFGHIDGSIGECYQSATQYTNLNTPESKLNNTNEIEEFDKTTEPTINPNFDYEPMDVDESYTDYRIMDSDSLNKTQEISVPKPMESLKINSTNVLEGINDIPEINKKLNEIHSGYKSQNNTLEMMNFFTENPPESTNEKNIFQTTELSLNSATFMSEKPQEEPKTVNYFDISTQSDRIEEQSNNSDLINSDIQNRIDPCKTENITLKESENVAPVIITEVSKNSEFILTNEVTQISMSEGIDNEVHKASPEHKAIDCEEENIQDCYLPPEETQKTEENHEQSSTENENINSIEIQTSEESASVVTDTTESIASGNCSETSANYSNSKNDEYDTENISNEESGAKSETEMNITFPENTDAAGCCPLELFKINITKQENVREVANTDCQLKQKESNIYHSPFSPMINQNCLNSPINEICNENIKANIVSVETPPQMAQQLYKDHIEFNVTPLINQCPEQMSSTPAVTIPPTGELSELESPETETKDNQNTQMSSIVSLPKPDLSIDTSGMSDGNQQSSDPDSPSFPVQPHTEKCVKLFPLSPKLIRAKGMIYLERSDYADQLLNGQSQKSEQVKSTSLFLQDSPHIIPKNLNSTVDVMTSVTPDLKLQETNSSDTFNPNSNETNLSTPGFNIKRRTFDTTEPIPAADSLEQLHNIDVQKRRTFTLTSPAIEIEQSFPEGNENCTFNMTPPSPNTELLSRGSSNQTDTEKRRTFNMEKTSQNKNTIENESTIKTKTEATHPLNLSSEAMDVDMNTTTDPIEYSQENTDGINNQTFHSNSPPIPTLQRNLRIDRPELEIPSQSSSPPLSINLNKKLSKKIDSNSNSISPHSPTLSIQNQGTEGIDDSIQISNLINRNQSNDFNIFKMPAPPKSPTLPTIQQGKVFSDFPIKRRPSLHSTSDSSFENEILSAKEQNHSYSRDEKDVFIENNFNSPIDDNYNMTAHGFSGFGVPSSTNEFSDEDFQTGSNLILQPSDFDYLLTKGNNNVQVDRSSLLLKFDPLLGLPVLANQSQMQHQQLQQILDTKNSGLSRTIEESNNYSNGTSNGLHHSNLTKTFKTATAKNNLQEQRSEQVRDDYTLTTTRPKKYANMSADVIKDITLENDCNKTFENLNSQLDEKQCTYKMDDLEKKIKNEVLKTEDIEKKLKESEQREEALIKRITEKDKTIAKMNGVIEEYEKAIAELIAGKEQLIQNNEKQLLEVKADRDSNYHHLTSLEMTFSDLHVKYEKSKEMTLQLKANEEILLAEKRQNAENLRLQEQRYDKMKNHAMQQLEIANKKLESLSKYHSTEITKLKALLKKEEISRASINEQLLQKSRENAELVKICDELINGQGS